jgi:hypothetical protein
MSISWSPVPKLMQLYCEPCVASIERWRRSKNEEMLKNRLLFLQNVDSILKEYALNTNDDYEFFIISENDQLDLLPEYYPTAGKTFVVNGDKLAFEAAKSLISSFSLCRSVGVFFQTSLLNPLSQNELDAKANERTRESLMICIETLFRFSNEHGKVSLKVRKVIKSDVLTTSQNGHRNDESHQNGKESTKEEEPEERERDRESVSDFQNVQMMKVINQQTKLLIKSLLEEESAPVTAVGDGSPSLSSSLPLLPASQQPKRIRAADEAESLHSDSKKKKMKMNDNLYPSHLKDQTNVASPMPSVSKSAAATIASKATIVSPASASKTKVKKEPAQSKSNSKNKKRKRRISKGEDEDDDDNNGIIEILDDDDDNDHNKEEAASDEEVQWVTNHPSINMKVAAYFTFDAPPSLPSSSPSSSRSRSKRTTIEKLFTGYISRYALPTSSSKQDQLYHVIWEDEDEEDYDEAQYQKGRNLYRQINGSWLTKRDDHSSIGEVVAGEQKKGRQKVVFFGQVIKFLPASSPSAASTSSASSDGPLYGVAWSDSTEEVYNEKEYQDLKKFYKKVQENEQKKKIERAERESQAMKAAEEKEQQVVEADLDSNSNDNHHPNYEKVNKNELLDESKEEEERNEERNEVQHLPEETHTSIVIQKEEAETDGRRRTSSD